MKIYTIWNPPRALKEGKNPSLIASGNYKTLILKAQNAINITWLIVANHSGS